MHTFYKSFIIFILLLLFTACSETSSDQKNITRSSTNVYGTLPEGEVTITIARDENNDGYVDEQEFSRPVFKSNFNRHYTASEINTAKLHAIRFSRLGFASITQDLVAGTQEINIEDFLTQYRTTISLDQTTEETVLLFSLTKSEDGYSASSSLKELDTSSSASHYFQLEVPISSLKKNYRSISAVFDVQLDPRAHSMQRDGSTPFGFEISKQINYVLLDENNQSIELKTAPTEIFNGAAAKEVFAFEKKWKQSSTTSLQLTRNLIVARKVNLSGKATVCVEATIAQGDQTKSLDEVQIDAIGQTHLRSVLADGESFEIYGDPDRYTFRAKTRYVPNLQESFTLESSQKLGCDFEAKVAFINPYTKTLHVHADTNSSYSLEDGYVWLHNNDYSFYSYAYLNALGDATFYVTPNSPYTLHYKNTQVSVSPTQSEVTLNYVDTPPIIYSYFTKEEGELFETLNVIALDNDPLLNIEVLQGDVPLQHKSLEQSNEYYLWRFDIDARLVGDNIFNIKVKDAHNENLSQTERNIPNYSPEILSVTFTNKYGDVFGINDTLYNTEYYLTITTTPDPNGNTIKTWGSFTPNSSYQDSMLSFPSGIRRLYINAYDGYEVVTKTIYLQIMSYVLMLGESNLKNEEIELGDSKTYYLEVTDPYGKELQYEWYVNGILVSEEKQLTYMFTQLGSTEVSCKVSSAYSSLTQSATIQATYEAPKIIELSELPSKLLYGNYTFHVIAEDMQDDNLTYEWVLNGEVVSTDANFTKYFKQDENIILICNVRNDYLTTAVSRATTVYYPKPVITKGLKNTQTTEPTTFTIDAYHELDYQLNYEWKLDGATVATSKTYYHVPQDDTKHTLTCKVSNRYKSAETSAKIGETLTPKDLIIDTFPGNQVVIYDDDMNITNTYRVDSSGIVTHSTTKSHLNFAVILDQNSSISKEMFFKFVTGMNKNLCDYFSGKTSLGDYTAADSDGDGYLDIEETYLAGLEKFDDNHNGRIEIGELYWVDLSDSVYYTFGSQAKPFKAVINMQYPVSQYTYKDDMFMSAIDGYIYRGNGRFVDNTEFETLKCQQKSSYIDLTITNMPYQIYMERENAFYFEPVNTNRSLWDLPQNEILSCQTLEESTTCTYRIYAHEMKQNGLSNYGIVLSDTKKFLYLNNITPFSLLTYDYANMKNLDFETALNTQNGSIYTQIVDDNIYTISSGDAIRGIFQKAIGEPYYLNNYWFSMQRDIATNSGDIGYDESSAFALVSNDSLPYYLELSRDFQAEKANLEASDIATFYQPYLDDMFYVSGASASDVNFVTYEYRLACQDASYVEIAVNLPNEYYRSDSSQRFIGFFDLDTNKSIQSLFPNEIVQDLEKVYADRDEGLIGCQDMKHFRLLELKEYTPFERDAIIEELKMRQLYELPRLQKSYYKFSDDYIYPN